jgi:predicted nuclease of restriction endonuclease-like (RecB) superfamily
MLYERSALSKKPDELIQDELKQLREDDVVNPDLVFHDPYFLDFLSLKDRYVEKDLEGAVLREIDGIRRKRHPRCRVFDCVAAP